MDELNQAQDERPQAKKRRATFGLVAALAIGLGFVLAAIRFLKQLRRDLVAARQAVQPRQEMQEIPKESYLNQRTIKFAGSGLFIALALIFAVAVLLLIFFSTVVPPEAAAFPSIWEIERIATPRPRVAGLAEELQAVQATEQARLAGYEWVDREAGVARIPIERAMQLLAREDGLPDE